MESLLNSSLSLKPRLEREFDVATLAGAVAAFGLMLLAIFLGGGVTLFFDLSSLLIVLGGTLGATLINFPLEDFRRTIDVLRAAFFPDRSSGRQRVSRILELARKARSEGLLSLQGEIFFEADRFLRKCIEMSVDGHDTKEVRRILELELSFLEDRHRRGAQLFQTMGIVAPAMGLIGTLIGLVQMLQNLSTPEQIGPAMATALLTTFYGAVLANLLFLPLAGKLRARSEEERLIKEMTIEGIVAVMENTNPRIIELRLLTFLSPDQRRSEYEF